MMEKRRLTENMLIAHYQTYPQMQIRDVFKFLHQSACGCEHFVSNEEDAIKYIASEAQNTGENIAGETTELCADQGGLTEPLDGELCRVHLDWIKAGLDAETLGRLFVLSAEPAENGKEVLEEKLAVFQELVNKGVLPFDSEEVKREIAKWREAEYPACHHSDCFRSTYAPAYRVIKKDYALFLPLFLQVDRMLKQKQNVTLAIEGGSASGKTTVSKLLDKVYKATVFHMDDFFLRPQQRTPERFAQPGGNVDWERFLEEVLIPLKNRERISYRRFDCRTFTIEPPVSLTPTKLTVIEGAYSMHPQLEGHYDLSVFLDILPKLQEARIRKRNLPAMAERFFQEWIPMEHRYFEATGAKERCDLVIEIKESFADDEIPTEPETVSGSRRCQKMDLSHITVNTQNSIRIAGTQVLYFDPFEITEESHDADVILVTHQHFDHFQPESIAKIKKETTMLIAPESMREKTIAESGVSEDKCIFLRPGKEVSFETLTIAAVPAYNVGKTFHTKEKEWVGYVVRMDGIRYYVAGDTDANPENETVSCDVALIPVGGHYTMDKEQAVEFTAKLSPAAVIPTHYGSLIGNPSDGAEFKRLVEGKNNQIQVEIKL